MPCNDDQTDGLKGTRAHKDNANEFTAVLATHKDENYKE